MRHKTEDYAKVLAAIISEPLTAEEERKVVANFFFLLKKNGDSRGAKKIIDAAEKLLRKKSGGRKIVLESARPLKEPAGRILAGVARAGDEIEEVVNPKLIAGIKVTVNDESQFDGSLSRKLEKMFKNSDF